MYILTDAPTGGLRQQAFDALDSAFGTGEFSQGQALTVITNALGADNVDAILKSLVDGGFITEVD